MLGRTAAAVAAAQTDQSSPPVTRGELITNFLKFPQRTQQNLGNLILCDRMTSLEKE